MKQRMSQHHLQELQIAISVQLREEQKLRHRIKFQLQDLRPQLAISAPLREVREMRHKFKMRHNKQNLQFLIDVQM